MADLDAAWEVDGRQHQGCLLSCIQVKSPSLGSNLRADPPFSLCSRTRTQHHMWQTPHINHTPHNHVAYLRCVPADHLPWLQAFHVHAHAYAAETERV